MIKVKNNMPNEFDIEALKEKMRELSIPGLSYAVVASGEIVEQQAISLRADEEISELTRFQAASISKPVSAIGIRACAAEKGIGLNDDLRPRFERYGITFSDFPGEAITLRQLLSHSAGFSVDGFEGYAEDRHITTVEILKGVQIDTFYYRQIDAAMEHAQLLEDLNKEKYSPIVIKQGDKYFIYGQDGDSYRIKLLQRPEKIPNPFEKLEFPSIGDGTKAISEEELTKDMRLDIFRVNGHAPHTNNPPVDITDKPGKKYKYSGGGITLAQFLFEKLVERDGLDFNGAMKKYVFDKLGMDASTFVTPLPGLHSKAHDEKGAPLLTSTGAHVYPESAAAGLWTTPTDLLKVLAEMERGLKGGPTTVLTPDQIREMLSSQVAIQTRDDGSKIAVGLGFFLNFSPYDGQLGAFLHEGSNYGFKANMVALPSAGLSIVIMTNGQRGQELIGVIMKQFSEKYIDRAKVSVSPGLVEHPSHFLYQPEQSPPLPERKAAKPADDQPKPAPRL
ncbi:MAG: beta-lactamase family protein [Rickettsiaceae bacterium]|nr:beta-lactamase family protein [Rickettsiaceae bacterium]